MTGNIRLSDKHGVNPSLGVCFWCGKDDGTVVLAGRLRDDREAPRRAVYSYDPCPTCAAQWEQGILLVECSEYPQVDSQPTINGRQHPPLYPTGSILVITEDAVSKVFDGEMAAQLIGRRRGYIDVEAFRKLVPDEIAYRWDFTDVRRVSARKGGRMVAIRKDGSEEWIDPSDQEEFIRQYEAHCERRALDMMRLFDEKGGSA